MPLITIPATVGYDNYIGNIKVAKTVPAGSYDSSLYIGDANTYNSNRYPTIESGLLRLNNTVSSTKSLLAFPINNSAPTTLDALYGSDVIINNVTLTITGVRSSSATPENIPVNFYYVDVPSSIAVEASTEGNPLLPSTGTLYTKKDSFKLGTLNTPIINDFSVTLDNSFYYYVKDKEFFYIEIETDDQNYNTPYLSLLEGQERRLLSTDVNCTATITINYTVGSPVYTTCTYTLDTSTINFAQQGGSYNVGIIPNPYGQCLGGEWEILNPLDYPWLTFNATQGFGPGISTLAITATNNSSDVSRTAVLYINDQILTIIQAGFVAVGCDYTIAPSVPSNYPVTYAAGSIIIPVVKNPPDCTTGSLAPTSSASWARPVSVWVRGQVTIPDFTVVYEANNAPGATDRTAVISVGDSFFTLVQSVASDSCISFEPSFYSISVPATADTRIVGITGVPSGCLSGSWSLISNTNWLTVTTPSGAGSGSASFSIAANASAVSRVGTLTLYPLSDPNLGRTISVVQAGVGSAPPPDAPISVTATLLSNNSTARITVDVGTQTGITGLYYRIIANGVAGNWRTISYINPFTVTDLRVGYQYYFDVALIKAGAIGTAVRTTTPIQPLAPPTPGGGTGIAGAKNVGAVYDTITDSVVLTWELNGQSNLTGYKINYYQVNTGVAYSFYVSQTIGTTYTVTDLSGFNRDQSYVFSIALVRGSEVSAYSPSNPVLIPLSNVTGQQLKIAPKLFYYPYPVLESNFYKQITHFVNRKTTGTDEISYYTLYSDDTVEAIYTDDAVRSGFLNSIFSLTNSYNDKTTAATTWNYENRVGFFYFELPTNSYIENPYVYLYFAPEPMGIPFDSDGVFLDFYSVPSEYLEEDGDQLRISKLAYTTSIYTPRIIDEHERLQVKNIKSANPVVIRVPIKVQNNAIFTTASGKKILPIKMAITLPEDFSIPTGYNALAFSKAINSAPANNSGIGFSGSISLLDRPVDFKIKPVQDDINIYWTASPSAPITKYEVTVSFEIGNNLRSVVSVVPASILHNVEPYLLSQVLAGSDYSVDTNTLYTIKMRALTEVTSDSSDYTYSLSATPYAGAPPDEILPYPPLNIKAFYGPEKVFVSWDAPTAPMDTPLYKFRVYILHEDGDMAESLPTLNSYIDQNNIKYEKYGIELNKENAGIENGTLYSFSVSSVSATGESYVQLSTSVLPNAIKRQQVIDNPKYKTFYEYPVELVNQNTLGQPLYPESVDGHSSIFGDLADKYDYLLASTDVGTSVTFTDARNICRIRVGHYTGEDSIFIINLPLGTYNYPYDVIQFVQSAIDTNILNGETLPLITGVAGGNRIFVQHAYTDAEATLEFVDGYNNANYLLFGSEPTVASPNIIIKAENYVPTVEYDKTALRSLSDSRPYRKVVKQFDIVPASKTPTSTTKYPLSFNLNADKKVKSGKYDVLLTNQYDDIRVGSVIIEWYVDAVKETLFDNGDGYLLSLPKVDACGNKVPSQALGVLDYASGIISCNLPNITSGYVIISYLVNEKVSNPQEYVWMPTPHYALELNMYEPIFFTYPHYAYIMQNQAKLKPGYTILEYLKINANVTSDLINIGSSVEIDIE